MPSVSVLPRTHCTECYDRNTTKATSSLRNLAHSSCGSEHQHTSSLRTPASKGPLCKICIQLVLLPLAGCESEVEAQQLRSLAIMLQARAVQTRPNARHRYSLTSAQLQSTHATPPGSSVTSGPHLAGQAAGQGSSSPSMSHHATNSHMPRQHATPPLSACHDGQRQSGSPLVPKQHHQALPDQARGVHVTDTAGQCSAQRHAQMRGSVDQSLTSPPDPSNDAGQTHHQSWGHEAQPAGLARTSVVPQARAFHQTVSRLGPFGRPQSTVSVHTTPKVQSCHICPVYLQHITGDCPENQHRASRHSAVQADADSQNAAAFPLTISSS